MPAARWIRLAAAFAAGRLGDVAALPSLLELVAGAPRTTACYAAVVLASLAPPAALEQRSAALATLRDRHADAVGHDRPLLADCIRRIEAIA